MAGSNGNNANSASVEVEVEVEVEAELGKKIEFFFFGSPPFSPLKSKVKVLMKS